MRLVRPKHEFKPPPEPNEDQDDDGDEHYMQIVTRLDPCGYRLGLVDHDGVGDIMPVLGFVLMVSPPHGFSRVLPVTTLGIHDMQLDGPHGLPDHVLIRPDGKVEFEYAKGEVFADVDCFNKVHRRIVAQAEAEDDDKDILQ